MDIIIRKYDPMIDEDFLYTTFMKGFRNSSFARSIPTKIYEFGQRQRINNIIEHRETEVVIATDPSTPEVIYGYAIKANPSLLHWIYVKPAFRGQGIARKLLEGLGEAVMYTHKGNIEIEKLLQEKEELQTWVYAPYYLDNLGD